MEIIIGLASGALITAIVALVQQFRLSDKVRALEAPKDDSKQLLEVKGEVQQLKSPVKSNKEELDQLRWQISMLETKMDKSKVTLEQMSEPKLVVIQPDLDGMAPPTPTEKLEEELGTIYSRFFLGGIARRYAPAPRNGIFLERQLTEVPVDRSNYELIILEPDNTMALFRLLEDPVQLKRAIKTPKAFIIPACQLIGRGGIERAQALECTYGIAVKDEKGNWKITKKSIVKYNMNMPDVYKHYEDELEKQYEQFIPLSKKEFQEKWKEVETQKEALRIESQRLKKAATSLALQIKNMESKQSDDTRVKELVRQKMKSLQEKLETRLSVVEGKPSREEIQILIDGGVQSILSDFKKDFVTQKELANMPTGSGAGGITPQGVRNLIREELISSGLVNKQELKELFRRYDERLKHRFGKDSKKPKPLKDDFNNIRNDFNDAW